MTSFGDTFGIDLRLHRGRVHARELRDYVERVRIRAPDHPDAAKTR